MRIGRSKTGAAGHIKKNTHGTSNEISFSVLDSMKGQDEEDDGLSPLGRISLFTLGPKRPAGTPSKDPSLPEKYTRSAHSAPSTPSWELTDREVKERRKHRKRNKRLVIAFVAALCAVALAFLGILGFGHYQQMQERALNLDAQIEDVRVQYGVAEPFFTLVESTLRTPLANIDASALDQQLTDWESRQQSIAAKLRATKTSLEHLEEQLQGNDAERANEAISTINATTKAMDAGRAALQEVSTTARSYERAEAFMTNAMKGDSDARAAAALELTDEAATNESIRLSNEAIADFAAARDAVQSVITDSGTFIDQSGAFDTPAADLLAPFIEYANLRIQAQEHAIEADEGYLEMSSQRMRDANAQYNAAEQQAAELIAGLRDAYPTDIVQRAYETYMPTSQNVTAWQTEWSKAAQGVAS